MSCAGHLPLNRQANLLSTSLSVEELAELFVRAHELLLGLSIIADFVQGYMTKDDDGNPFAMSDSDN